MNKIDNMIEKTIPSKKGIYNGLVVVAVGIVAGITVSNEMFFAAFLGLGYSILNFKTYNDSIKKANILKNLYRHNKVKAIEFLEKDIDSSNKADLIKLIKEYESKITS